MCGRGREGKVAVWRHKELLAKVAGEEGRNGAKPSIVSGKE